MYEQKKKHAKRIEAAVGLFVIAALAALFVLSMQVAGLSTRGGGETYQLNAKFDDIGGLKPRAPVKIGGVVVGRVSEVMLDHDDWTPVVRLNISRAYADLPETTSASIQTSGLLGEQYVALQPGFMMDGFEMLADGDYIEDTKPALVLENLISQFLFSQSEE